MHNAIKAAIAYHTALMVEHHHKIEISSNVAREDARVTSSALLRCLKTSTLSDDDDDGNDAPEKAARNDLIRRHKTCLIERRKQDSEAKDSFAGPSDP
jgi:hypothetical protein